MHVTSNKFILTSAGTRFYPAALDKNEYKIEDIALALSKEVRYNGHCTGSYTVAQHSVICSYLVDPKDALCALLHDATEAYIKDMPRPVKDALGASYLALEQGVWKGIASTFNLPQTLPEAVRIADMSMMAIERRSNIVPHPEHSCWDRYMKYDRPDVRVHGVWSQVAAQNEFLMRYGQLIANG